MKSFFVSIIICLLSFSVVYSQNFNPVSWDFKVVQLSNNEVELVFEADIEEGWKLFSNEMEMTKTGPLPTAFVFHRTENYEMKNTLAALNKGKTEFSEEFQMEVVWYEEKVVFKQRISVQKYENIVGYVEYMSCSKHKCLPPVAESFVFKLEEVKSN